MTSPILAQFGGIGPMEMMIVAVIGLLLFGKRLPEVAKSMGQGLREFKSGMSGFQDEVHRTAYSDTSSSSRRPLPEEERAEVTAPKFEPPTSAPQSDDEAGDDQPV